MYYNIIDFVIIIIYFNYSDTCHLGFFLYLTEFCNVDNKNDNE